MSDSDLEFAAKVVAVTVQQRSARGMYLKPCSDEDAIIIGREVAGTITPEEFARTRLPAPFGKEGLDNVLDRLCAATAKAEEMRGLLRL